MKKIILVNIVIFIILSCLFEIISYYYLSTNYKEVIENFNKVTKATEDNQTHSLRYNKIILPNKKVLYSSLRPIEQKNSNKSIVLFGCSYTEGFGLKDHETFSHKLSEYTGLTVINRGKSGEGLPFMYYQLSDNEFLKSIPDNTEYFIYTLINDHLPRLARYRAFVLSNQHSLQYKIKNDKLVLDGNKFEFLHSFFTSIIIENYIYDQKIKNTDVLNALFLKIIQESNSIIKNRFPKAKFVILYINETDKPEWEYPIDFEGIKSIDKNIQIIKIKDFIPDLRTKRYYWLDDNFHPSAKAWDEIVPIVSEQLKLK